MEAMLGDDQSEVDAGDLSDIPDIPDIRPALRTEQVVGAKSVHLTTRQSDSPTVHNPTVHLTTQAEVDLGLRDCNGITVM